MSKTSRRRAALITGVVIAALAASFLVSPAAAGTPTTQASWGCDTFGFSSLTRLGSVASTARGGQAREPALDQLTDSSPQRPFSRVFAVTVPTWVHVVSPDGVTGNVSQALIDDQIDVLNTTFGGGEGGVDTGFTFQLAGVTRTVNADWYFANPGGKERAMKRALHTGGPNTLNLYLTTAGDYLGWAYLPKVVDQGNAFLDGIVVDWESLRGASDRYRDRYDQGETGTHEAGHWLNLEHTFFRGCNGQGDYINDTPYEATPTTGCPAGKDTCPAPGIDPIHNYMDYSYDQCYTEFTAGQAARMQTAWDTYRAP
jgi:hypothetical protein